MSNEKLSPEIMEKIEQYTKDRYPINEVTTKADQSALEMFRSIFKEGAERGATIALTKQWVKVTDRLPENYNYVLIAGKFKEGIGVFGQTHYCINGKWYNNYCAQPVTYIEITHWMPLSSPPQD